MTGEGDKLTKICLNALNECSSSWIVPDMDAMLKEYFDFRGCDHETGKPTMEKLIKLGLNQTADDHQY